MTKLELAPTEAPGSFDAPGLEVLGLEILGMTCAACQRHVQGALTGTAGVRSARVDLMRHRASVEFDPATTEPELLVKAVRDSGYDAVLSRGAGAADKSARDAQSELKIAERKAGWKAAVTIAAGAITMLFSMPLGMQAGAMSGMDGLLLMLAPRLYELPEMPLRWALLVVTSVLAVWAGSAIYRSAWKALLHGETNMNTLVSLGTGVAFLYSAYGTIWDDGSQVYFDSVLLILGFLLLGKWLEGRARHQALAAVDALAELQPATARVRRLAETGGLFEEVTIRVDDIKVGDVVVILPGERVPVDGVIESGRTTVDESMLTGESLPVARGVGERVLAGAMNFDGAVTARVESAGEGTTLRQIARLVEKAQGSRAPMERLADRASAIFVPVVLGLAVVTFVGWLFAGTVPEAIAATVSVLVIACPCAMGLAVPAALTVAIGRGAQFGVLIKGGEALERVAGIQAIVMDKTGTLTLGKPLLIGIGTFDAHDERELLKMAASVEDHSAHPLAHAVVAAARERGLSWEAAAEVQVIPGRGLSAVLGGKTVLMGNPELMREWSVPLPETTAVEGGVTRLWFAVDHAMGGYFDARDVVRPSAAAAVTWMRKHGLSVEMLTGDSASAAAPIAQSVGISKVAAGLLPLDKVERIRVLQAGGTSVAMVGDGINDAGALAQADAGMAMGAGAALAQEAGDVLLLSSDPASVCTSVALARATVRVMRQNLGWALGYNLIGIPVAAGLLWPLWHVTLTPWMAAAAMAFSSVSVLLNSLRLRGWKAPVLTAADLK